MVKKIRGIKGTFHAKMDTVKDKSCMALTEEEDIKKRWHKYTGLLNTHTHTHTYTHTILMIQITTMV